MQHADVLALVCDLIKQGRTADADSVLTSDYPPAGQSTRRSSWSKKRLVKRFVEDGFTDRYFGDRLVFPGTLLALSVLLGQSFPYHRNWKQSVTHPAFYELYPTIDHVIPVARGGEDDDDNNIVTTSMLRNSAKANWLLEELGWPVERAPLVPGWDGLLGWFLDACDIHEALRQDVAIQQWRRAAM